MDLEQRRSAACRSRAPLACSLLLLLPTLGCEPSASAGLRARDGGVRAPVPPQSSEADPVVSAPNVPSGTGVDEMYPDAGAGLLHGAGLDASQPSALDAGSRRDAAALVVRDAGGLDGGGRDAAAHPEPGGGGSGAAGTYDAAVEPRDGSAVEEDGSALDPVDGPHEVDAGALPAPIAPGPRPDGGVPSLRAQICAGETSWPSPLPAPDQRAARRVGSRRFGFLEGPVWVHEQGALLFSDLDFRADDADGPPSRVIRLIPPDSFELFVPASGSNGLARGPDGAIWAAVHDQQSLARLDARTGMRSDLRVLYRGERLNSPNDLVLRSDGTVYLSDPTWQLGDRESAIGKTGVYRVSPQPASDALAATLIDDALAQPNGLALSPDERTLYVGSSDDEVWRFDVAADGSVSNKTQFASVDGSDGMTVDCAGNLYVTSGTIEVFAPDGSKLGELTTPEAPSNVAFGGSDHKTLYITAESGLYQIPLLVPGFPY